VGGRKKEKKAKKLYVKPTDNKCCYWNNSWREKIPMMKNECGCAYFAITQMALLFLEWIVPKTLFEGL
jgi:hypothetical protein